MQKPHHQDGAARFRFVAQEGPHRFVPPYSEKQVGEAWRLTLDVIRILTLAGKYCKKREQLLLSNHKFWRSLPRNEISIKQVVAWLCEIAKKRYISIGL